MFIMIGRIGVLFLALSLGSAFHLRNRQVAGILILKKYIFIIIFYYFLFHYFYFSHVFV